MYLNDVQKGGGTIFPELNIIVEAKEGRLVIFENTIKNGLFIHLAFMEAYQSRKEKNGQ